MKYLIEYEKPEMAIFIFSKDDIATNLQASGIGTGVDPDEGEDLDFDDTFN